MDELIRKAFFKPYLKLNKHAGNTQPDSWPECRSLLILHEGNSPTLAYFDAAIRSRFPGVACQLVDTLTTPAIEVDKGTAIVVIRFISSQWQNEITRNIDAVSYTHLTLPTKRIV